MQIRFTHDIYRYNSIDDPRLTIKMDAHIAAVK